MKDEKKYSSEVEENKKEIRNERNSDLDSNKADDFDLEDHLRSEKEEEKRKKRKKIDLLIEWALIFILGILVGIAIKTEAQKTITVGFNDHKMKIFNQDYNINKLQKELANKAKSEQESQVAPEEKNDDDAKSSVQSEGQVSQD